MKKLLVCIFCVVCLVPSFVSAHNFSGALVDSTVILDGTEIVTPIDEKEATNDSYLTCSENVRIPYQIVSLLRMVETLIKIGVPIILIVMGMIDFGKVVIGKPDDQMKKTKSAFTSRLISAVLVFFVVSIVEMILPMINTDDEIINCTKCIILNQGDCTYVNVDYPSPVITPTPTATITPRPTSTPTPTPVPTIEVSPTPSPEN